MSLRRLQLPSPLLILLTAALSACEPATVGAPEAPDSADLVPFDTGDGKADGPLDRFDMQRLISDEAFGDAWALDADEVQQFFEGTPYDRRSFLADLKLASGERASTAIVRVARAQGLNPLVLLVKLQKEMGLVSRETRPARFTVDFAFGCGCRDGQDCSESYRGFDKQLECAGELVRQAAETLAAGESIVGRYRQGEPLKTSDGYTFAPANRATAILYAYTPWVLPFRGGNWLFWNIWRRYATHLGYTKGLKVPFNEGFIGGRCSADSDCFYRGGYCQPGAAGGAGTCSLPCTSTCPDRSGGAWATTYCAPDGAGGGACVASCDAGLVAGGCPTGQSCQSTPLFGRDLSKQVCLAAFD